VLLVSVTDVVVRVVDVSVDVVVVFVNVVVERVVEVDVSVVSQALPRFKQHQAFQPGDHAARQFT
jgi:transcription elongation factor